MKQNLYLIICEYLKKQIAEHPTPNYKLPTESQLMMKFNASRVTVRRAFFELEEQNLIYKIKGKGSFVKTEQSIRFNPADRIAFIYPNFENKHPRDISRGIRNFFEPKNIDVNHFETQNNSESEQNILNHIRENEYKGVILMPVDEEYFNSALLRLVVDDYPAILVDRKLNGLRLSCISSDHRKIGYRATKYLTEKRHCKRIAYISTNRTTSSIYDRLSGYKKALSESGRENFVFSFNDYDINDLFGKMIDNLADFLKRNEIDGVICNSGYHTAITLRAFAGLGKMPEADFGIAVIDCDSNIISTANGYNIPYIEQDSFLIGQTAAKSLFDRIYRDGRPEDKFIEIKEHFEE